MLFLMISLQLYELAIIFKFECKCIANIPKVLVWLAISAKIHLMLSFWCTTLNNVQISGFHFSTSYDLQNWTAKLSWQCPLNYQVCITLSPCWRFEEKVYFCFFVFLEFDGADWTKNSLELRVSYTSYIQAIKKQFLDKTRYESSSSSGLTCEDGFWAHRVSWRKSQA